MRARTALIKDVIPIPPLQYPPPKPQSTPILLSTMLRTILLPRKIPTLFLKSIVPTTTCSHRLFTNTALLYAKDPKMNTGPPKHEMVYFPDMTSALPSKSGEFRRVLWTGLYSQVVLMTVPVGGDIGDEVRNFRSDTQTAAQAWSSRPAMQIMGEETC